MVSNEVFEKSNASAAKLTQKTSNAKGNARSEKKNGPRNKQLVPRRLLARSPGTVRTNRIKIAWKIPMGQQTGKKQSCTIIAATEVTWTT
eukprot:4136035-Amphidinium_carterae.1